MRQNEGAASRGTDAKNAQSAMRNAPTASPERSGRLYAAALSPHMRITLERIVCRRLPVVTGDTRLEQPGVSPC